MSDLHPVVVSRLRELGIHTVDPDSQLHADLVDVFTRLGNAPEDVVVNALLWCYHAEHDRQVVVFATAKTEYERVRGAGVIRYRVQGERSAEVAGMKAESEDPGVHLAAVEYRKAERMIDSAKQAQNILHARLRAWQTNQANDRQADAFIAKEQA